MAEGNEKDENSYPFDNYSRKKEHKSSDVETENEDKESITLDLGIGNQHKLERRNVNDNFSEEYFSTPTGENYFVVRLICCHWYLGQPFYVPNFTAYNPALMLSKYLLNRRTGE